MVQNYSTEGLMSSNGHFASCLAPGGYFEPSGPPALDFSFLRVVLFLPLSSSFLSLSRQEVKDASRDYQCTGMRPHHFPLFRPKRY